MKQLFSEIFTLVKKDFLLEFRQRSALNSILLYVFSTVFVCYLSFSLVAMQLNPITWNTLFWIILLFSAINTIAKSFVQESDGQYYFYYSLVSPQVMILAKILYNALLMIVTAIFALIIFILVMGNPVQDLALFIGNLILGAIGFAVSLTLIAGVAIKANKSTGLMAILGFPIIIPMILMLIKVSKNAVDGLDRSVSYDEILTIFAINLIVVTVSYILFPYLWRS
ncbi:heme exporter protein CcmB [Rapidithrix thailandica]|uniref:Heme exporter protein CcmB n=1 Tax=Rapidithrix thailandica TaxID=413964 RepID=A0AAW9S3E0_9BACT